MNRGFSLIEVLTALLVGAIVVSILISANLNLRQSTTLRDRSMEIERNILFIQDYFRRQLSQVGARELPEGNRYIHGTDASDSLGNDTIRFTYSSLVRCTGDSGNYEELIMNGNQFRCHADSGTPQPMLDNVRSIQYLYGVDSDGDHSVDSYQNATSISDWQQVHSVMVGVLLRSATAVLPEVSSRTFTVLDTTITVNDRYMYYAHHFVVMLRNRLGGITPP
jgi:prepilin-type N-terminal cleavage/methylation domain-containing protein